MKPRPACCHRHALVSYHHQGAPACANLLRRNFYPTTYSPHPPLQCQQPQEGDLVLFFVSPGPNTLPDTAESEIPTVSNCKRHEQKLGFSAPALWHWWLRCWPQPQHVMSVGWSSKCSTWDPVSCKYAWESGRRLEYLGLCHPHGRLQGICSFLISTWGPLRPLGE